MCIYYVIYMIHACMYQTKYTLCLVLMIYILTHKHTHMSN